MDGETGVVVDYTYDDSGNILSKVTRSWNNNFTSPVLGSVVSNITYSYTDAEWKDLLTNYNGQTLTYDAIGNPLNYRDGITLTWQNGRELASYADATQSITYTYDASGMRTGKTVTASSGSSTNYSYVYENGLLLKMTRGNRSLEFNYDALGTPVSIKYKSSASATPVYYYYGLNSRGDVVSLYNSDGSVAAVYTYDAYGKLLSVKTQNGIAITSATSIANLNPLRYRGYVYDNETGLYYLQSRYYDPTTCRFVNADASEILVASLSAHNDKNLFSYCDNNPVSRWDYNGYFWEELFETIEQAKGYFAVAAGVSQADSFVPGPADILSAAMFASGILVCIGIATYSDIAAPSISIPVPKADEKVDTKKQEAEKKNNFWAAGLLFDKKLIIGQPLTAHEAALRVSQGKSIMCRNEAAARYILFVNGYHNYVGPEIGNGCGFYPHFHPTRNHTGYKSIHIWYYP